MKLRDNIILTILLIIEIVAFGVIINNQYQHTKIQKEDLIYVSENFESSKQTKSFYRIICESGKEYLVNYVIVDKEDISNIKKGDQLILGVDGNIVVELEVNENKLITIEDCHKKYSEQLKVSLIITPVFLGFTGLVIFGLNFIKIKKKNI